MLLVFKNQFLKLSDQGPQAADKSKPPVKDILIS